MSSESSGFLCPCRTDRDPIRTVRAKPGPSEISPQSPVGFSPLSNHPGCMSDRPGDARTVRPSRSPWSSLDALVLTLSDVRDACRTIRLIPRTVRHLFEHIQTTSFLSSYKYPHPLRVWVDQFI